MSKLSRSMKRQAKAQRKKQFINQLYQQATQTPAGSVVKDMVSKDRTISFAMFGKL